jgi:protein O-GlcNAc transferase
MQKNSIPSSAVNHVRTLIGYGRFAEAIQSCRAELAKSSDSADLWFWLGTALHMQKALPEALESFRQALSLAHNPTTLSAVATLLSQMQQYGDALPLATEALALVPGNPVLMANLGTVLMNLGRLDEALGNFNQALLVQPDQFNALLNRGQVLAGLNRQQEATDHNRQAITLLPQVPEVYFNYADTLLAQFRYEEALKACEGGLKLAPEYAELIFKKALCLAALADFDQANTCAAQARKLNPQVIMPFLQQIGIKTPSLSLPIDAKLIYMEARYKEQMCCYWPHRAAYLQFFSEWLSEPTEAVTQLGQKEFGFQMFSLDINAQERLTLTRLIAKVVENNAQLYALPPFEFNNRSNDRLKIGYVSPDFRLHPTGLLTRQIYGLHDREQFEIYAYSLVDEPGDDAIHRDIVKGCDIFRHVSKFSDIELAQLIYEDGIDILIDLAGYTTFSRSELFALRPAPLQVSYVGFVESMGADFIDYVVTDINVYPPDGENYWHEQPIRMPHHVLPYDNQIGNAPTKAKRSDFGLPDDVFVFCCLNNSYKIEPKIFDVWANILKAVPGSVLWLLDKNEQTRTNLQNEAKARGIATGRLIFAPFMHYKEHVLRYQMADLFLDTIWHNAHTTALEALWQGLPVLTCEGNVVSARLAASCLHVLGLPELVANGLAEYEIQAIGYALNPRKLANLREKLSVARYTSPLFNTALMVKNLEYAYQAIWQRYKEGKEPIGIDIPDSGAKIH